jgi:tetratricopeptide (TPR) repeat protein
LGNYGAAIKHFAALTNPESPIVLESKKQLAECEYLSGDTLGAFLLLSEMSKTNLFGFDDLFLRGLIFLNWSKYDSAIRDFTFYINRIKTNILAYMYRGEAFMGKKDYPKAVIDFSAALSIDPNNKNARYNRGLAYFQSSEKEKAYDDFKFAESLGHPLARKFISDHLKNYIQTE